MEQIDVIKRLIRAYPDDLQYATSAQGKYRLPSLFFFASFFFSSFSLLNSTFPLFPKPDSQCGLSEDQLTPREHIFASI